MNLTDDMQSIKHNYITIYYNLLCNGSLNTQFNKDSVLIKKFTIVLDAILHFSSFAIEPIENVAAVIKYL